ncbi:hypothetical protein AGR6A_Cc150352 [Agrobacterium sp. NCPPB 925]|nr:hypothetical protein AGR6A_Cc150352 [Agrobacterium sp. NCPPB 925]
MFWCNSIATKPLFVHFPLNYGGGADWATAELEGRGKVNVRAVSARKRGTSATVEKTSH